MKYKKLVLAVEEADPGRLIAEIGDLGIDQFRQLDNTLVIYLPCDEAFPEMQKGLNYLLDSLPNGKIKSEATLEDQNWNAVWEATIQPQSIGRFLVKPSWSAEEPEQGRLPIEIDPKMAFGTGYHATTQLMLRHLPEIVQWGDTVLDAGTGTGILAIAAVKLGAARAVAFDNDENSIINARENLSLNNVEGRVNLRYGDHKIIDEKERFDVILANIQRNIIEGMMPFFAKHLATDGRLLVSGVLEKDKDKTCNYMESNTIKVNRITRQESWIAIRGQR